MKPIVAIVGRPNVGKSTLFNRIAGRRKAITTDEPGVTRDLNYAEVDECGRRFVLVDTGGFESRPDEEMASRIKEQALFAIEDADAVVFVMDARTGPTSEDAHIVGLLRKTRKPVFFAANKADSPAIADSLGDFFSLKLPEVYPVSAEHGLGVYELLEAIAEVLPASHGDEEAGEEAPRIRVALVGRPNAGKSSLLNRLIGRKRAIVSPVAGTTIDPVDTPLDAGERKYTFIDTAGIRRKTKVSRRVEAYAVMAALKSIERCDVACLVIDGHDGVSTQDERVAGLIERSGVGAVIVVNKWDIVEKDTHTTERFEETIRERIPFLSFAPIIFVSALTGKRATEILSSVNEVYDQASIRVTTNKLNKAFEEIKKRKSPPVYRGRAVKLYYVTQISVRPPTLVVFANYPSEVSDSYRRYLVNRFRESLGIDKAPLKLHFKLRQ
jgi:GTP-binding protein